MSARASAGVASQPCDRSPAGSPAASGAGGKAPATAVRVAFHLAVMAVTVALSACTPLDDVMVAVFGRGMRDQSSFDPYENPLPAPEGAVPFASGNLPPESGRLNIGQPDFPDYVVPPMTQADLLQQSPAVMDLENPVPATTESLERGEVLYDRYCVMCHGETGVGAEATVAARNPVLAAYDLSGPAVQGYPDGYIYGMIRVGRGLMPPYGHALSHFDRWHVVNYVRELQAQVGGAATGGDANGGDGPAGNGAPDGANGAGAGGE